MRIKTDDYTIVYEGGRLADIEIDGHPVECVPVRTYDLEKGEWCEPEPTREEVVERVAEWINPEDMPNYQLLAQSLSAIQKISDNGDRRSF